jgi:hypothetical protein
MVRDEQPRFPVGEQQFRKTARPSSSARKAARLDQLASLRRLGLLRKLRRLRLFGTRLVIVVTLFTPLASARPFILPAIQSTAGLEIANAGDTSLEQPYAWVTIMCFIMILAGLAWTAWVRSRPSAPTPLWCQHALLVSGLLSLTMSIAWTAILYTVDANQSPRYLALGCWSMFITAFISESYQHLQQSPQYAFMVVPVFILALHLTLFLVNQNIGPEQPQVWDLRRFYENAPLAFTLWAILLCWIYYQWTPDDCSSEGVGENIDLESLPATSGEGGNDGNPGDSSTPAGEPFEDL